MPRIVYLFSSLFAFTYASQATDFKISKFALEPNYTLHRHIGLPLAQRVIPLHKSKSRRKQDSLRPSKHHIAPLAGAFGVEEYVTPITIGDQTFLAVVDTGR